MSRKANTPFWFLSINGVLLLVSVMCFTWSCKTLFMSQIYAAELRGLCEGYSLYTEVLQRDPAPSCLGVGRPWGLSDDE